MFIMIIHCDFLRFQSCREICNCYLISIKSWSYNSMIKSSQRSPNSEIDKRVRKIAFKATLTMVTRM